MEKLVTTVILAIVAIAAIAWACSYRISGLAWFPGFIVAVFCGIGILDINQIGQDGQKTTRF